MVHDGSNMLLSQTSTACGGYPVTAVHVYLYKQGVYLDSELSVAIVAIMVPCTIVGGTLVLNFDAQIIFLACQPCLLQYQI